MSFATPEMDDLAGLDIVLAVRAQKIKGRRFACHNPALFVVSEGHWADPMRVPKGVKGDERSGQSVRSVGLSVDEAVGALGRVAHMTAGHMPPEVGGRPLGEHLA